MKALYHFIRLVRPVNLLVIALTMGVFQTFMIRQIMVAGIWSHQFDEGSHSLTTQIEMKSEIAHKLGNSFGLGFFGIDFILLVLSTILIAAGGNIINDYFDVKADRINKPDKVIIGIHIKRRWAIILNWVFNSIGMAIGVYLSWKFQNIWLLIIPFVSINLLWFYSMYYKRKFLVGNIVVALLTGIIPLYIYLFHNYSDIPNSIDFDQAVSHIGLFHIVVYSGFAFMINFIREIIKDIADIKGDLRLKSKTLPISWGIKKTKIFTSILFIISLIPILFYVGLGYKVLFYNPDIPNLFIYLLLLTLVIFTMIFSLIILLRNNQRKKYLLSSNFLKLAMLFGLLSPLFL